MASTTTSATTTSSPTSRLPLRSTRPSPSTPPWASLRVLRPPTPAPPMASARPAGGSGTSKPSRPTTGRTLTPPWGATLLLLLLAPRSARPRAPRPPPRSLPRSGSRRRPPPTPTRLRRSRPSLSAPTTVARSPILLVLPTKRPLLPSPSDLRAAPFSPRLLVDVARLSISLARVASSLIWPRRPRLPVLLPPKPHCLCQRPAPIRISIRARLPLPSSLRPSCSRLSQLLRRLPPRLRLTFPSPLRLRLRLSLGLGRRPRLTALRRTWPRLRLLRLPSGPRPPTLPWPRRFLATSYRLPVLVLPSLLAEASVSRGPRPASSRRPSPMTRLITLPSPALRPTSAALAATISP